MHDSCIRVRITFSAKYCGFSHSYKKFVLVYWCLIIKQRSANIEKIEAKKTTRINIKSIAKENIKRKCTLVQDMNKWTSANAHIREIIVRFSHTTHNLEK